MTWNRSSLRLWKALSVAAFTSVALTQVGFAEGLKNEPTKKPAIPAPVMSKLTSGLKHQVGVNSKKDAARDSALHEQLAQAHRSFTENKGQWNSSALFRAKSEGLEAWVSKNALTFDFFKRSVSKGKRGFLGQVVRMQFNGTAGSSSAVGQNAIASKSRFVLRKSTKPEIANSFKSVLSKDLYAGVDLKTYFSNDRVRYDFVVKPGADASQISFSFNGANSVKANGSQLILGTQLGPIAQTGLFAYQMNGASRVPVAAEFVSANGQVSFKLGAYDHSKTLVIDPVVYGSYFGGNDNYDEVHAIVSDTTGGVYVTGTTQSTDFPITTGPYFSTLKGSKNAFLCRFQGDAYNVDYSVYFGGSNTDIPQFIQLDPYGNIWVAGTTTSPDFPGNTKATTTGNSDIFVIRFAKSTSSILDPTTVPAILMVGGSGNELLQGFAIVPVPNAPVSGPTTLLIAGQPVQSVPEIPGTFTSQGGFLLSYSYNGEFSKNTNQSFYIGDNASFPVTLSGLATDASGAAYLTGSVGVSKQNIDTSVNSGFFNTTAGVFTNGRLLQGVDLFIRKYATDGTMTYSCLLGGADDEVPGGQSVDVDGTQFVTGSCIAVDPQGNAYIVGVSPSFDYPRSRGSYGETWADGFSHVVVTKISADASTVLYSTNLKDTFGETSPIEPSGIAIDGFGQAYVTGNLLPPSLMFPNPPGDPDSPSGLFGGNATIQTGAAGSDAPVSTTWTYPAIAQIPCIGTYLNVLDPTGSSLVYGTYLSGMLDNAIYGPYVDSYSDVWVYGWTAGRRRYTVVGTTSFSPNPPYDVFASLPAGLITSKAYKNNDSADALQNLNFVGWDPNDVVNGSVLPITESRDGWLAKLRVGRPVVSSVVLGQSIMPGGLGASTTVTVTLSGPAPAQGAQVDLSISNSGVASFGSSGSIGALSVVIAAGQTTTAAIPIYSLPVTGNTPVQVKGTYDGNFVITALNVVPWLQNLSLNPTSVVGGNSSIGTITLSFPAPASGIPVSVGSASANLTFPTSGMITVPSGASSATFNIGTLGVDSITSVAANATVLGVSKTAGLQLNPASLMSLVLAPAQVSSLGTITGTVSLTGLPGSKFPLVNIAVKDSSNNVLNTYTIATSPLTFTNNTATFTITTPYEPAQAQRLAVASMPAVSGTGYAAQSVSSVFIVDPSALLSLSVDKTTPNPGDTINALVTLANVADQGGAAVTLTSSNTSILPIPASFQPLTILAGQTSASAALPLTGVATTVVTPVTLTATRGTVSKSVVINVQPAVATLAVVDLNNMPITTLLGGSTVNATVTLSAPAPEGGLTVVLNSTPSGLGTLTGTTTVAAGQTVATFQIAVGLVTTTTSLSLSATVGGGITTNTVTFNVTAAGLQSVSFIPSSIRGTKITTGKVVLTGPAPAGGTMVTLTASNTRLFPTPITVVVPAGKTFAAFSVFCPRVSRALAITWSASDAQGDLASAVLTILR